MHRLGFALIVLVTLTLVFETSAETLEATTRERGQRAEKVSLAKSAGPAGWLRPGGGWSKRTTTHGTVKTICVLTGDQSVSGDITITQEIGGTTVIKGEVSGLNPGFHGFHIHEFGDLSNGCTSTGAHYNPHGKEHGGPDDEQKHAGDLGNIEADHYGVAKFSISTAQVDLTGPFSIVGRSMVVHADVDDFGKGGHELSKTTGNSRGRLACCIIGITK